MSIFERSGSADYRQTLVSDDRDTVLEVWPYEVDVHDVSCVNKIPVLWPDVEYHFRLLPIHCVFFHPVNLRTVPSIVAEGRSSVQILVENAKIVSAGLNPECNWPSEWVRTCWQVADCTRCWQSAIIGLLHSGLLQRIRGFLKWYALYKSTFYLLTYLLLCPVWTKR